jgi:hypothetical protein
MQGNEQAVRLVDTIGLGWYVAAVIIPIVGFVAGIVFMAKSKIGPSVALWMTATIASVVWTIVFVGTQYGGA